MGNRVVFHNTYALDGTKLHWEAVAGETKDSSADVDVHDAEIVPGVFLVGWMEESGMTVTHAIKWTGSRPPSASGSAETNGLAANAARTDLETTGTQLARAGLGSTTRPRRSRPWSSDPAPQTSWGSPGPTARFRSSSVVNGSP